MPVQEHPPLFWAGACARLTCNSCTHRYYYSALNPAAVVNSGDQLTVETATHQAGDDYDKMVKGDPAMEVGCPFGCSAVLTSLVGLSSAHFSISLLTVLHHIHVSWCLPASLSWVDTIAQQAYHVASATSSSLVLHFGCAAFPSPTCSVCHRRRSTCGRSRP